MINTLLANKNKICYTNYSGAINPPIFDRWNWIVAIPQQFTRSAFLCYLLTVLVPPVLFCNNNYLLLIKNNINKLKITKRRENEH